MSGRVNLSRRPPPTTTPILPFYAPFPARPSLPSCFCFATTTSIPSPVVPLAAAMISPSAIQFPTNSRLSALFLAILGFAITVNSQILLSDSDDKRNAFGREFLSFGKRIPNSEESFRRDFMAFGKRSPNEEPFQRDFMAFGKRAAPSDHFQRDFMAFGKRGFHVIWEKKMTDVGEAKETADDSNQIKDFTMRTQWDQPETPVRCRGGRSLGNIARKRGFKGMATHRN
uniref:Uncharacterized protein n=1 Tax=Globodera rostochiensis TaxID=31243 RepID=A0A914HEN8_GLORO